MKFIVLFTLLLIYYSYIKYIPLIEKYDNLINKNKKKLKMLTYNVQRLPYYFRPNVDIDKLMGKYDVVCLQEYFCSVLGLNKKAYGYNCIIPSSPFYKIVNSGLAIYSKYPLEYIDFISFDNLSYIDGMSDKGFLIVKFNDLYIINTHLQSSYEVENNDYDCAKIQLNKILDYCKNKNLKKVVICGDMNLDLKYIDIDGYKKIISQEPTHWNKMDSYIQNNSATYKIDDSYLPFHYDGGFYKNIKVKKIKTVLEDEYADHLGVSFKVKI
jgi:exonuclease III